MTPIVICESIKKIQIFWCIKCFAYSLTYFPCRCFKQKICGNITLMKMKVKIALTVNIQRVEVMEVTVHVMPNQETPE